MDQYLKTIKVKDIVNNKVIALNPLFSIIDAINCFNLYHIDSAIVIDEHCKLVGFCSESDCIRSLSNAIFYDEINSITIQSVMSKDILSANENWDVFQLEQFLIKHNLRSAPVVNDNKRLVGMISRSDVLKNIQKSFEVIEKHKKEIKTPKELTLTDKINIYMQRPQVQIIKIV